MQRLRTISRFVRVLVALFVAAQFAGVVSSPLALGAENPTAVSHTHHHHMSAQMGAHLDAPIAAHSGAAKSHSHGDRSANHSADPCCALHAFFAGVLPAMIAVEATSVAREQRVASALCEFASGIGPGRLDRPPRPLVAI